MESAEEIMSNTQEKLKPLTPRSYSEDEVTWRKHVPWLQGKDFKFVEVPKEETIAVRREHSNAKTNH